MLGNPLVRAGRLIPIYEVLMQWRNKPGNFEVARSAGLIGSTISMQLYQMGWRQKSYSLSYFSGEWDGWRLFEGTDLEKFRLALRNLRDAPDPAYGFNNTGGIQMDKWLETKFTIGRAVASNLWIKEPTPEIVVGEIASITIEIPAPLPAPDPTTAALVYPEEPIEKVTFSSMDPARVELVANADDGRQEGAELIAVDIVDYKATVGVRALEVGEVSVFIHPGDPPDENDYENDPRKGILFGAEASNAKK